MGVGGKGGASGAGGGGGHALEPLFKVSHLIESGPEARKTVGP